MADNNSNPDGGNMAGEERSPEEIEEQIRAFAAEYDYVIDEEALRTVIKGLQVNYSKYGGYYCPCRRIKPEDPTYLATITCPCLSVHEDIATSGCCHCRLYWTKT
ncbi:MAG TPA: ferredoxin-thioredoxin reductase catalytic domain-containing protein [Candidatus Lokiarchaeia archaeon]|nr:ferredoxin-thioredoxin reductase catalytic domain-containing protein [Candidatus Lokiarchaeia archaeon]